MPGRDELALILESARRGRQVGSPGKHAREFGVQRGISLDSLFEVLLFRFVISLLLRFVTIPVPVDMVGVSLLDARTEALTFALRSHGHAAEILNDS